MTIHVPLSPAQGAAAKLLRKHLKAGRINKGELMAALWGDATPHACEAGCDCEDCRSGNCPATRRRLTIRSRKEHPTVSKPHPLAVALAEEFWPIYEVANQLRANADPHHHARGSRLDRRQLIADLISRDDSPFTPDDESALRSMSATALAAMADRYLGDEDDEGVKAMTAHENVRDRAFRVNGGRTLFAEPGSDRLKRSKTSADRIMSRHANFAAEQRRREAGNAQVLAHQNARVEAQEVEADEEMTSHEAIHAELDAERKAKLARTLSRNRGSRADAD